MNCTEAPPAASSTGLNNNIFAVVLLTLNILNTILTMAAPYILKTRTVQAIVHPNRVEKKKKLQASLEKLVEATNEAIRNMSTFSSTRSDSEHSAKIDPLSPPAPRGV